MNVQVKAGKLGELAADTLVVPLFEGAGLGAIAQTADQAAGGLVATALAAGDFKGKPNQTAVLYAPAGAVKRIVLVGLGKEADLTDEKLRGAGGKAAACVRDLGVKTFAFALPGATGARDAQTTSQAIAEGAMLALFQLNDYRTRDRDEIKAIEAITFWAGEGVDAAQAEAGVATARILAESIALTRTLVVHPGNVMTATRLGEEAKKLAAEVGLKATVMGLEELRGLGFGGLLAVNQGSEEPPAFIILEWQGGGGEKPLAVVGKGVTFDTGGISIKPSEGMEKMKYDMAGAAAVFGIMRAVALLKLPRNVVGLIPATDNMPSGKALKPGDVYTSYSGQTVEVHNTDAEGRLVLSDALHYAVKDRQAEAILDMATLTGAVMIALGTEACGVMGNNQELVDRVLASGEATGDRGWQLPLWKEYNELLKSEIADMKNIGGREAGTITAACFLARFVGETPWVHLDIASTAWTEKDRPYRPKGPTGMPVRLVVDLIRNWKPLTSPKGVKF